MHKQYELLLFHGARIQLKHSTTNEYLFSNQTNLTTGYNYNLLESSKQQMLGCTQNYLQEGAQFQIFLIYQNFGDLSKQPIHYGDLVCIKQKNFSITIKSNPDHKSQTSKQKEAILIKSEEIQSSQIFVILPSEIYEGSQKKISECIIKQASIIRLINIKTNLSLRCNGTAFTQKDLQNFKEVSGSSDRDPRDDWFINLHEINYMNGIFELNQRFKSKIFHGNKIVIRNTFLGTCLYSNFIKLKSNNFEVASNFIPRIQNDIWEIVLYLKQKEIDANDQPSLNYHQNFALLHLTTNSLLKSQLNDKYGTVYCTEENLDLEWKLIPLNAKDSGLIYCNQHFYIQNKNNQQYLATKAQPSQKSNNLFKVFLQPQISNESIWTIETVFY